MAKKQVKKRVNIGKIMLCVLIFLIVAALGVSITFNVLQAKQNKALNDKLNAAVDVPPNPDDVIVTPIEPDEPNIPGIQTFSLSPQATVATDGNAVTSITCTSNVPYADLQLEWIVAWKDAESEWATGKNVTSYVIVNSSGNATADCIVKKAFAEQVIIKAVLINSESDTEISATCTVDYVCRYNDQTIKFDSGIANAGSPALNIFGNSDYYLNAGDSCLVFLTTQNTIGTLNNKVSESATLSLTDKALTLLNKIKSVYASKSSEFKTSYVNFNRQDEFINFVNDRCSNLNADPFHACVPVIFGTDCSKATNGKYYLGSVRNASAAIYNLVIFGMNGSPDGNFVEPNTPISNDTFLKNLATYKKQAGDFAYDVNLALAIVRSCVEEIMNEELSSSNYYLIDDFFTFSVHFESDYTDYTFTQSIGLSITKSLLTSTVTNITLDPSQIVA